VFNKPRKIIKLEFNNKYSIKMNQDFSNAELVFNNDTKRWDIDLRGIGEVEFDYQDQMHITFHLDSGEIFTGEVLVNLGGLQNSFNLQGINDFVRVK
jgi:hypothetical protein